MTRANKTTATVKRYTDRIMSIFVRVVIVREPRRSTRHADVVMDMSRSRAQAAYAATVDNRRASQRWPHRLHRHPPPAASASLLRDSSLVWHSRHVACR